ncbi:hypothetical protein FKW50_12660 [Acetobacter pomorum]|nr:hypothetical protein FKW54_09945 [Acetobacter pomorum]KAA8431593.1 hypothetical protein FKW50_12660 [Acetobacter pomorum]KAA8453797.1 hypothetical protein FKW52_03160 [Acetobacter pomorum]
MINHNLVATLRHRQAYDQPPWFIHARSGKPWVCLGLRTITWSAVLFNRPALRLMATLHGMAAFGYMHPQMESTLHISCTNAKTFWLSRSWLLHGI